MNFVEKGYLKSESERPRRLHWTLRVSLEAAIQLEVERTFRDIAGGDAQMIWVMRKALKAIEERTRG